MDAGAEPHRHGSAASCAGPSSGSPWLAEHSDAARLFVTGDSAGANIAHNVTLRVGGGLPGGAWIEGMVLVHPYFRGGELLPSEDTDPKSLQRAERTWGFVSGGRYGIDHPFINPLALPAEECAKLGCQRALVTVCELDAMRDRGRRYETQGGGASQKLNAFPGRRGRRRESDAGTRRGGRAYPATLGMNWGRARCRPRLWCRCSRITTSRR